MQILEVEKALVQVAIDLKEILVLDGIDLLPDLPGFRIRCHDLYGPLPDTVIEDTGDRYPVLDHVISEAAKRVAMARIRREIAELHPGCEFLLPTSTDKGALVGIRIGERTVLAEGPNYWDAYHALKQKASMS